MRVRGLLISILSPALLVTFSCKRGLPLPPPLSQVARGNGVVAGHVRFAGRVPKPERRTCTCDPTPGAPKVEVPDRTVRVSKDGGLADVFVYVVGGPKGSGTGELPLLLDQRGCDFQPHALAIQVGQSLRIRNSDPTLHNVRWVAERNRSTNLMFGPQSQETVVAFAAPEFLETRCDVHDWMGANIGIFENPFFATTDESGAYHIAHLPPGDYRIAARHGYYGDLPEQRVTVGASGEASVDFTCPP